MSTLTPSEQVWSLAKSRVDLADRLLLDAQRESNGLTTRHTCASDVLYLYALAAIQAPAALRFHPYQELLIEGARHLNLDLQALDPICQQMNSPRVPFEASDEQVQALIALALAARQELRQQSYLIKGVRDDG